MKKLLSLLFVFTTSFAFSQEISGIIRDRSNLKEVVYASVFYKKINIGTYSDSTGNFKIQKIQGDTLIISSLGFEKFLIPADDIKDFMNISLLPVSISLNEVVVKSGKPVKRKNGKKIYLGNLFGKGNLYISGMKGRTVAYLIKPDASITGQIKSIQYAVKAEAAAMVRAHLFTVDAITGKPGEDLLKKPEFLAIKSGSKNITINLSHLNIELPFGGIYVGLEWIGEINSDRAVNISPTYTNSKSATPIVVYIKFMGKNWEPKLKNKVNLTNSQKEKNTAPEFYFDEPNFKITLIQ